MDMDMELFDEPAFRSLVRLLAFEPDELQAWTDEAVANIHAARTLMADFVKEHGDGEGYENAVGAYWVLAMGERLTSLSGARSTEFWQFVAFDQLLGCAEEDWIVAADDAESIWDEITERLDDAQELELDEEVFEEEPEDYLELMQERLDTHAGDEEPYRMLSLVPPLPDGANLYVALVKQNKVALAIELFSRIGVMAKDPVADGFW